MDDFSLFFCTIAVKGFWNAGFESATYTDFFFDSSSDSADFESELDFSEDELSEEDDSAFSFFGFPLYLELPGMSKSDL